MGQDKNPKIYPAPYSPRVNVFGTKYHDQITDSLHRIVLNPGGAQWFQQHVKPAVIISDFRGDALGPVTYIGQNHVYMEKVLPYPQQTLIGAPIEDQITAILNKQCTVPLTSYLPNRDHLSATFSSWTTSLRNMK